MLTIPERQDVERETSIALAAQTNPKSHLQTIFLMETDEILAQLPLTINSCNEYASHIMGSCLASRWVYDPSLLELLLNYLVDSRGLGRFVLIRNRVRRKEDPNPDPYGSKWLMKVHPFVDREVLREKARILIEENAYPILKITAPPETFGRTYSRKFFEHLEDNLPGDTHFLVEELSLSLGPSYRVQDLAESLGAQLGVTEVVPDQSGSSYPMAICRWILKHAMACAGRWIIMLDGFSSPELNPDVKGTIEALAEKICSGQFRRRIRLVLVDYPAPLPQVSPADLIEEVLYLPSDLSQANLKSCIEEWNTSRRANGKTGLQQPEINKLAEGMVKAAPANGKARLESFNKQLSNLLQIP